MPALSKGIILIWSGAIVDVPAGFVLCDGNNDTPDLRNMFIVGAGDSYDPHNSGGSVNHNHPFTTDGHSHELPSGASIAAGTDMKDTTTTNVDTGTTDNADNLPPYYSLAYIMKT